MDAQTQYPTLSETLNRIYDELDGIAGGEIDPRTAEDLDVAMRLVSKAADREEADQ